MSVSISIVNLRSTPFAHPEFSTLDALETATKTLKTVNADDYRANYPLLAAFGVALSEGGSPAAGAVFATAAYAMTAADSAVVCDNGATPRTITLPASASVPDGTVAFVYHRTGAGLITVDGDGADTVNGNPNATLTAGNVIRLVITGTNWASV